MIKISTIFTLLLSLFLTSCSTETYREYYIFDEKENTTFSFIETQIEIPTYALFVDSFSLNIPHVVKGKDLFDSLNVNTPIKINKMSKEEMDNVNIFKDSNTFYFVYSKTIGYPLLFSEDFTSLFLDNKNEYYKLHLSSSSVISIYNYVNEYGAFLPNIDLLF